MNILVAEDEALIAFALEDELLKAGHTVIGPVASVEEALAASQLTPPELALLNVNLQKGGKGADLARALLQRYGAPSIFISGNPFEASEGRDAALGYISKPFSFRTVVAAINVAKAIIAGQEPDEIPEGFELYRNTLPDGATTGRQGPPAP